MFALIFTILLAIVTYYIFGYNKLPKEIENIPSISGLYFAWTLIRRKNHEEVQQCFGDHDVCIVRHRMF